MLVTRDRAWQLLTEKMQNQNLRRHCLSVEAVMRALAKYFEEDQDKWAIVGLLHDGDYEISKTNPAQHTLLMSQWLREMGETDDDLLSAILSHNYVHTGQNPPHNKLEWALYCCDELTGFIVAVTLVKPTKKLADVTVDSILSKWPQKAFAAGVHREQVEECQKRLGIDLSSFIQLSLSAMQAIAPEIGL